MNKAILIGRLGKDAEIKEFQNGGKLLTCTVATSESYKNKDGEWIELTDWHSVKMSGDYVEKIAARLKKGLLVSVEGKIKYATSEKDGKKTTFTNIVAESIKVLEKVEKQPENKPEVKVDDFDLPTDDNDPF